MIRLTLPYPISANRYWRTVWPKGCQRPVTTVSNEARKYKTAVRKIALEAGAKPIKGRVKVFYTLYPHWPKDWQKRMRKDPVYWDDTVQCIDLDNAQKILFDALEGVVFENDKLVRRIEGKRVEPDPHGARIEVQISAWGEE